MPWYTFKEIWTPLKFFGIKLYKELDSQEIWVKVFNNPKKRIFRS